MTQNIQMMTTGRRIDHPRISIVTRSGAAIGDDKVNENKEYETIWVRKIAEKSLFFDIQKEKKIFMEAK